MHLLQEYRITATYNNEVRELQPVNNTLLFTWDKEGDNVFHRLKLKTLLTLCDSHKSGVFDYTWLSEIEEECDNCEPIEIEIERICNGEWRVFFRGKIDLKDSKFKHSRCVIDAAVKPLDEYTCLLDEMQVERNLLDNVKVTGRYYVGEVKIITKSENYVDPALYPFAWTDPPPNAPAIGWTILRRRAILLDTANGEQTMNVTTTYAREEIEAVGIYSVNPPTGNAWLLVPSSGGSIPLWVRPVSVYYSVQDSFIEENEALQAWKLTGGFNEEMDNGVTLENCLNTLVSSECDLEIVSDFFSINPIGDAPDNEVYQEAIATLANVVVWQKSDAKRPNATQNATIANATLTTFLLAMREMWDVRWFVKDGTFRIEHLSFFEDDAGFNLVLDFPSALSGRNNYTYKAQKTPREEVFKWMDSRNYETVFDGKPIKYACGESDVITHNVGIVTTDLEYIRSQNEDIDDSGFFFANMTVEQGVYYFNSSYSLDGILRVNYDLSFENLHTKYWRYGRFEGNGQMNGQLSQFKSVQRCKQQEPIELEFCCEDTFEFDPSLLMHSNLGWGEVLSAEYDTRKRCLKVVLLHDCGCIEDVIEEEFDKCIINDPKIAIFPDAETGCVTAQIGGMNYVPVDNQKVQYKTDDNDYQDYIIGQPICNFETIDFRLITKYKDDECPQKDVQSHFEWSNICDNKPEINFDYDAATNCISANLGGAINSQVAAQTWEYLSGATWMPYTENVVICNFGEVITFRVTVEYEGGCGAQTIEQQFDAPNPICMNAPYFECSEDENGCVIPLLLGYQSEAVEVIYYRVNLGAWKLWNGEPICETGILNFKAVLNYCDGCPTQCVFGECEGCDPPEAGTATPIVICVAEPPCEEKTAGTATPVLICKT